MSPAPNDQAIFEPEVEALLAEAAADPNSLLLRVPRDARAASRAWSYEPVRVSRTGLTSLERHLIAVHNGEIAAGLRALCAKRLVVACSSTRVAMPLRLGHCSGAIPSDPGADARLHRELEGTAAWREGVRGQPEHRGLDHALAAMSVEQLAALALRFEASAASVIHIGVAAIVRKDFETATAQFRALVESTSSVVYLSYAWTNIGLMRAHASDALSTETAYRYALRMRDDNATAALSTVFFAIQRGARDAVVDLEAGLAHAVGAQVPGFLDRWSEGLRARRSVGLWAPSPQAAELVGALRDRTGPLLWRVFDEFQ